MQTRTFSHGKPPQRLYLGDHVRLIARNLEQEKGRERLEAKWKARPRGEGRPRRNLGCTHGVISLE